MVPPFTPILLAGMMLRPLPLAPLQPALAMALRALLRRHPDLLDRLAGLDAPVFVVDPVDLPFDLVLRTHPRPSLRAVRDGGVVADVTAIVRGPLLGLIDLLQGRDDGDSLFFSRRLIIEGDTGAVLALRAALDGAEVDLAREALASLGPLGLLARRAMPRMEALFARAREDMDTLAAAALAPLQRRVETQGRAIARLEATLGEAKTARQGAGRRTVA